MKNGEIVGFNAKFLAVGTTEIREWSSKDAQPFVLPMETEDDFDRNGFDYEDYADMNVGEVRKEELYEGIIVIRIM